MRHLCVWDSYFNRFHLYKQVPGEDPAFAAAFAPVPSAEEAGVAEATM